MKTLTVDEACALLKIHRDTLYQRAKAGLIPGAKIGKSWVFIEEDLINFIRGKYKCQPASNPVQTAGLSTLLRPMVTGLDELLAPRSKRRLRNATIS